MTEKWSEIQGKWESAGSSSYRGPTVCTFSKISI